MTPNLIQQVDYYSWMEVLPLIVSREVSCQVALQKISENADKVFRCLTLSSESDTTRDFLYEFVKKVIHCADDVHDLVIHKFNIIYLNLKCFN